ncbi:beta-lactamase family protein [Streptomyces sp. NBC_01591]|uniref:serine hydrolase domain-containing protein n=1 Tax=Streptomyces sp. NBC_01591 TaxID=2975888 RepID=UPI002DD82E50|nr:serine hydrolase domain-containing protein [Streptomyces sp. NBC_01591]WSD71856.1 beta-lactamase family protein [Streptomyces sp. NBC_01591]
MNPVDRAIDRIRSAISNDRHLGVQLYASVDGETVVDEAFGEGSPGTPLLRNDAVPWICSTKLLGAMAVSQLLDEHGMSPGAPVAEIVPEFGRNGKHDVTIAQLMSHTVPYAIDSEAAFHTTDHKTALASLCATSLSAPPGSRPQYSPFGSWIAVAEWVGRLSGVPYEEYVHRDLLSPLGLRHTVLGTPEPGTADEVVPLPLYGWEKDPVEGEDAPDLVPFSFLVGHPSVGAHGPAHELARLLECLVQDGEVKGHRVLRPGAVRTIATAHRSGMVDGYFGGLDVSWGLGACVDPILFGAPPGSPVVGHTGTNCGIAVGDMERGLVVCHLATNKSFQGLGPGRLESRVVRDLYGLVR